MKLQDIMAAMIEIALFRDVTRCTLAQSTDSSEILSEPSGFMMEAAGSGTLYLTKQRYVSEDSDT